MGNLPSNSNDSLDETVPTLKINMDFKKAVEPELKQLLGWSLNDIRQIYVPFRKRKGSPILTRSEFLRFIRMSRMTSFYIYDNICKNSYKIEFISVFQIMAILILCSHATNISKIQFITNVFDLVSCKSLQFRELILMFKSIIRGYALLTNQGIPNNDLLQKYADNMFSRADLNNDQNLQITEVISWFEGNTDAIQLFKQFQPKITGKQGYHIFNSFYPYTQSQSELIYQRMNKFFKKEKLQDQDFNMLKPVYKINRNLNEIQNTSVMIKLSKSVSNLSNQDMIRKPMKNLSKVIVTGIDFDEIGLQQNKSSNFEQMFRYHNQMQKQNELRLSPIKQHKSIHFNSKEKQNNFSRPKLQSLKKSKTKKKFENIIIIKGKTITKKDVFDLRQYFDRISNGKKIMYIEDFIDSFNQQKYSHMKSVAASLYNFLDKNQSGKVTFFDLVLKLYPNLTAKHIESIRGWCEQYNRVFNLQKKIKANRSSQQAKKRILPKSCLPRYKEIYQLFDKENKGYVSLEDLRKVLGQVSTQKQLLSIFQDCDTDKDGKLSIQQFMHVILPPDLDIQGLQ